MAPRLDDRQLVRPNEIGSAAYIKERAFARGASISEFELDVQFRCAGSEGFVNWINNTLGIERTANVRWDGSEGFDFQIYDSPQTLDRAIREKATIIRDASGNSVARPAVRLLDHPNRTRAPRAGVTIR